MGGGGRAVEDSSVGVQVLTASAPPDGFYAAEMHGLVDELLVEEDPENDWQERPARARGGIPPAARESFAPWGQWSGGWVAARRALWRLRRRARACAACARTRLRRG
jgi:hypothetical protein